MKNLNKKRINLSLFLIIILLFSLLIIHLIHAEDYPGQNSLPLDPEKTQETVDKTKYTLEQIKSEYLSQEWKKMLLNNTYLGPVIKAVDPVSTFLLGRKMIFTWAYLLILAIFITITIISYQAMKSMFNMSGFLALIAGLIIASLASRYIPQQYLEFQFTLIWKVIIFLSLILIAICFSIFWKTIKKAKEKMEKEQEKQERKFLHVIVEIFKNMFKKD